MKNTILLISLLLVFSCKKEEKSYSQVLLKYKLFSLNVNLEGNYILISRSKGFKELDLLPPPYFEKNSTQKEIDSITKDFDMMKLDWALPITKIYKFSPQEKSEILAILKTFKQEDLEGTIEFPQGHCAIFNIILVETEGKVYDVETQCYYTKNQEKLKNLIFETAIKNEKDSLNLAIINRSKNLQPHE